MKDYETRNLHIKIIITLLYLVICLLYSVTEDPLFERTLKEEAIDQSINGFPVMRSISWWVMQCKEEKGKDWKRKIERERERENGRENERKTGVKTVAASSSSKIKAQHATWCGQHFKAALWCVKTVATSATQQQGGKPASPSPRRMTSRDDE